MTGYWCLALLVWSNFRARIKRGLGRTTNFCPMLGPEPAKTKANAETTPIPLPDSPEGNNPNEGNLIKKSSLRYNTVATRLALQRQTYIGRTLRLVWCLYVEGATNETTITTVPSQIDRDQRVDNRITACTTSRIQQDKRRRQARQTFGDALRKLHIRGDRVKHASTHCAYCLVPVAGSRVGKQSTARFDPCWHVPASSWATGSVSYDTNDHQPSCVTPPDIHFRW